MISSSEAGSNRDVAFVTIDSWRHDSLRQMPNLRERIDEEGYEAAEVVCAAPATRGAFGALFGGRHYPRVYAGFDDVRDDIRPLPAALSEAGYAAGGFVGSNPFLSAWGPYFDEFWNDDLDADAASDGRERFRRVASTIRRISNYLRFQGRARAASVAARARDWYQSESAPRFLWMHLMDPHVPYFPGVKRALRAGPLSIQRAHWRFNRDPDSLTEADRETLRDCYDRSVEYLDAQIDRVLEFIDDDAVVVVVGDHGEEFDHGVVGHARLYDETVRVPLLTRGVPRVADGDLVRQIDLAPTVLSSIDRPAPDGWDGRAHDGRVRSAFLLNHSPRLGRVYTGIRTERVKLVRVTDVETDRVVDTEAYDLSDDPAERTDVSGQRDVSELFEHLDSFLASDSIREGLLERPQHDTSVVVEDRLNALGYK